MSSILAIALFPYGVVHGEGAQAENHEAVKIAHESRPAGITSRQVLNRLGIEVGAADAQEIEEALLVGEDPIKIAKMEIPDAAPSSENIEVRTIALINQIPLAARAQLFQELAQGAQWDQISPEILAQIPLAVAAAVTQESSPSIERGLPAGLISLAGAKADPPADLPLPYDQSYPVQQMVPVLSGVPAGCGVFQQQKPGNAVKLPCVSDANAYYRVHKTESSHVQSIYYRVTGMPTGPPQEGVVRFFPSLFSDAVSAEICPTNRSLAISLEDEKCLKQLVERADQAFKRRARYRLRNTIVEKTDNKDKRGVIS